MKKTYVVDTFLLKKLNQWEREFEVDAWDKYDNLIDYNEAKYNYIWTEWNKYEKRQKELSELFNKEEDELMRELGYKR